MIHYNFNPENQTVYADYSGCIEEEELLRYGRELLSLPDLPKDLKILEDGRNATYNFKLDINQKVLKNIRSLVPRFNTIKCAFVQDKPRESAYNLDYETRMPFRNFKYKVFFLRSNAEKWLETSFHSPDHVISPDWD